MADRGGRILCFALLMGWVLRASAHSYLFEPMSRNLAKHLEGGENCPHCGQGNGAVSVKSRANGQWPTIDAYGSHGLCGDPFQGTQSTSLSDEKYMQYTTNVQRTYTAGSTVGFVVAISTHHKGHFEFRISEHKLDASLESHQKGQEYLNQRVLERVPPEQIYDDCVVDDARGDCQPVDVNHKGRWYVPPVASGQSVPGPDWSVEATQLFANLGGWGSNAAPYAYHMYYKIPEDLTCQHCTLQWYWVTGNTCLYDGDYFTYFRNLSAKGWNARAWSDFAAEDWASCSTSCCNSQLFGEEFWNCADIAVIGSNATAAPTPAPTPAPTATTAFLSQTTTTTPPPTGPGQCTNPQCGCPPFTDGATWCDANNYLYDANCQVDETACSVCYGHWCYGAAVPTPSPTPVTTATTTAIYPSPTPAPSTTGCYLPVCGCPPFENGPAWCTDDHARYPAGGHCATSASTCGDCLLNWCSATSTSTHSTTTSTTTVVGSTTTASTSTSTQGAPTSTTTTTSITPTPTTTLPTTQSTGSAGCYNPQCGCPPFTSGPAWCTENSAKYSVECQVSAAACDNCNAMWCGR